MGERQDSGASGRETAELSDYLRVTRERIWVICLCVVVVTAAALAVSLTSTPQYRATSTLVYQKNNLDQVLFGSQFSTNTNQDREVQTGASLVKLGSVADAVKTSLKSSRSSTNLLEMVSVKSQTSTNVVQIQAVSNSPLEAASVANAFAQQFVFFRQQTDRATVESARKLVKDQLDTLSQADLKSDYGNTLKKKYEDLRILESMQNGGFTVAQQATNPTSPFSPQPIRNGILGFAVGLVLGFGLAFLLEYLDRRIKDQETLELVFGAPVLAAIPEVGGRWTVTKDAAKRRSLFPIGFASHSVLLESFRTLRSSLQYFDLDDDMRTILLTSGLPQEGKTVTTINLGLSLALSGKRVVLLDADLRRPMLHRYLNLRDNTGLTSVLAGTHSLTDVLQMVRADAYFPDDSRRDPSTEKRGILLQRNLYVLPAGPLPPNPAELLASPRMAKVLEEIRSRADYVLIDSPPVLMVSDALALAPYSDAVIVTTRILATSKDEAQQTRNTLARAGARVIGVVAGGIKSRGRYGRSNYGYGYGREYGYGYGYGSESKRKTSGPQPQERKPVPTAATHWSQIQHARDSLNIPAREDIPVSFDTPPNPGAGAEFIEDAPPVNQPFVSEPSINISSIKPEASSDPLVVSKTIYSTKHEGDRN